MSKRHNTFEEENKQSKRIKLLDGLHEEYDHWWLLIKCYYINGKKCGYYTYDHTIGNINFETTYYVDDKKHGISYSIQFVTDNREIKYYFYGTEVSYDFLKQYYNVLPILISLIFNINYIPSELVNIIIEYLQLPKEMLKFI